MIDDPARFHHRHHDPHSSGAVMIRTCAHCGREFEVKRLGRIAICSAECRREANRKRQRAYYAANRERIREQEEAGRKLRKEWRKS
jgi:hypothetical protein